MYNKYDIVFANLNPQKGDTQAGIRPCVIVQSNIFNNKSPTLILVPLTSNIKKPFPSEFIIKSSNTNGLSANSRFLGSQIITIDKEYITRKIGFLEEQYIEEINKALFISLDLDNDF